MIQNQKTKFLKLSSKWTKKLICMPESGMNYQIVKIRLKNGQEIENLIVVNCETLLLPDNGPSFTEKDIAKIVAQ